MQGICLAILRFSLCTWVGISTFFIVAVLKVVDSILYDSPPLNKFSQATFFLPPYFGFAFPLFVAALLCAFGGLANPRIGLLRRWSTLLLVTAALGLVAVDYAAIYREVAVIFGPGATLIEASTVVALYRFSRLLKIAVLGVSVVAASLAVWPEISGDLTARRPDPAL
jgi:hypothetical protein